MAAQLAPVPVLERLAAAAALAEALDPRLQLGDLGGLAGGQRRGGGLDPGQQLVDRGDHRRAGAVEPRRDGRRTPAAVDEVGIGGEDARPGDVAAGRRHGLVDDVGRTPSARSRAAITAAGIERKSMRTHREAIVMSSGGTKSASTTNVVDGGGSSIGFSSRAAASAVSRWKSWSTTTCGRPRPAPAT